MRRTDREVTDLNKIRDILSRAKILRLALNDGAQPYVVPLHYGYTLEDGALTFCMHCALEGHKLDLLRADPHAAFELDCDIVPIGEGDVACVYGSSFASVMGRGIVEEVTDTDEKIAALRQLMLTQTGREFSLTAEMTESVCVLRLTVSEFSAKCRPMPVNG